MNNNGQSVCFSIIIPIYNTNLLGQLLQSFSQQTYDKESFQLILIDDGSTKIYTDTYKEILKRYHRLDIVYMYIGNKNGEFRVNKARNIGVSYAHFEHIIYLDGDSIVPEYYLTNFAKIITENQSDIIIGESIGYNYRQIPAINANDIIHKRYGKYLDNDEYSDFRSSGGFRYLWHVFLGGNFYIHKNNLEKILPWEEGLQGWGEDDIDFAFRAHILDLKFKICTGVEIYNVATGPRMTREKFHSTMTNQYYLFHKYEKNKEYLEYILQRFYNTPEEFTYKNIPVDFEREFLNNIMNGSTK